MSIPRRFQDLDLSQFPKTPQGYYIIPASYLDDNFAYLLSHVAVGDEPTDKDKYFIWIDNYGVVRFWDGTEWKSKVNSCNVASQADEASFAGIARQLSSKYYVQSDVFQATNSTDLIDSDTYVTFTSDGNMTYLISMTATVQKSGGTYTSVNVALHRYGSTSQTLWSVSDFAPVTGYHVVAATVIDTPPADQVTYRIKWGSSNSADVAYINKKRLVVVRI